jgi:hypothetical protein
MGLLLMIAVPSFQSASRGGKLRSAVFSLNTSFSLARQNAISSRQNVYVLFPDEAPELYRDVEPQNISKTYRSYAIYGQRDGYLSEWRDLPLGVIIDPEIEFGGFENFYRMMRTASDELFLIDGIRFPTNGDDGRKVYGVGFRSDGPIHVGGLRSPTVFLSEGWTDYDPLSGSFDSWGYVPEIPVQAIRINSVTGQTQIRELFR